MISVISRLKETYHNPGQSIIKSNISEGCYRVLLEISGPKRFSEIRRDINGRFRFHENNAAHENRVGLQITTIHGITTLGS